MQRRMSCSRARHYRVKPIKLALLTKDRSTNLHNLKTRESSEYIINCLLNILLEFGPGHWSLPSEAPTTWSRLLEVRIVFQYPRHLQVRLLFT
jgi:hypothetical protein